MLSGGVALMVMPATGFAADEAGLDGGRFYTPLLSRLLPNFGEPSDILNRTPASTARFSLNFFTTVTDTATSGAGDNSSGSATYLAQLPVRQSATGIADLDYGSYYGATRLDLSRFNSADGYSLTPQRPGDHLNLSLEAGGRHDDLNAGMLYAYRSSYSPLDSELGFSPYPMYIFTPVSGVDAAYDERSHDGHAVFLYLGYNFTQHLNVRGTLGLARTSSRSGEENSQRLGEQSRRWGVDLAATYRLLDNLVYEAHLGYVSIEDPSPSVAAAASQSGGSDSVPLSSGSPPASLYQIGSHIRMTF